MKPKAVLISDIHFNISTLEVADTAMRLAIAKANELNVRLIVTGDLHDTKANIRGECITRLLATFRMCKTPALVIRGNHDSINEKSSAHSLDFLNREAKIVATPEQVGDFYCIPYQHSPEDFKAVLTNIPKCSTILCHQGVTGSNTGHYMQDNSKIPLEWVKDYRVISGHYHQRQTIHSYGSIPPGMSTNGPKGFWDYVGNPYTLTFGEVNDPEKGFQILYEDGSLEFVPTNLRRHRIIEMSSFEFPTFEHTSEDILWFKVSGQSDDLSTYKKEWIKNEYGLTQDFKLDLIPTDTVSEEVQDTVIGTQQELLDTIIDKLENIDKDRKLRLKALWKGLV
jgi:DNA repair exonuclease SbcCD nuclease subunit